MSFWCIILIHSLSLSNCTEQSSTQEIPHLTWLLKIHYTVNKGPQIVPVLSHFNSFHNLPPYFMNNFNVIHLYQRLLSGLFLSVLLIKLIYIYIYIYISHISRLYILLPAVCDGKKNLAPYATPKLDDNLSAIYLQLPWIWWPSPRSCQMN